MLRLRLRYGWWGILVLMVFVSGVSNLSANTLCQLSYTGSGTSGDGLIKGSWISTPVLLKNCSAPAPAVTYNTTTNAGYAYTDYSLGGVYYLSDSTNNGKNNTTVAFNGWHGYNPSTTYACNPNTQTCGSNAQNYLNYQTWLCQTNCYSNPGANTGTDAHGNPINPGITFTLHGNAGLETGDGTLNGAGPWRNPTNDAAYYLSTPDHQGITIQFGIPVDNNGTWTCPGCISNFSFYWGSVDPWNEITFTDYRGSTYTEKFYGSSLNLCPGSSECLFAKPNYSDTTSMVVDFAVQPDANGNTYPWQSVTFSSPCSDGTTTYMQGVGCTPGTNNADRPAFEFDNLQWIYASSCCPGDPIQGQGTQFAPAPEPSGLLLLASGVTGLGGLLRRRVRW